MNEDKNQFSNRNSSNSYIDLIKIKLGIKTDNTESITNENKKSLNEFHNNSSIKISENIKEFNQNSDENTNKFKQINKSTILNESIKNTNINLKDKVNDKEKQIENNKNLHNIHEIHDESFNSEII